MKRKLVLLFLVLGACVAVAAPVASAAPVLRLSFDKVETSPGVWHGTATGAVTGPIVVTLTGAPDTTGAVWHIGIDWVIDAGSDSFTAQLAGTLDPATGRVVLDGAVTSGYLAGSRAHLDGAIVDPSDLEIAGTLQIQ